jgi:hypothetical protein
MMPALIAPIAHEHVQESIAMRQTAAHSHRLRIRRAAPTAGVPAGCGAGAASTARGVPAQPSTGCRR